MKRYSDKSKHLSIRFDKETHDKMFYIAEFEKEHGPIEFNEENG